VTLRTDSTEHCDVDQHLSLRSGAMNHALLYCCRSRSGSSDPEAPGGRAPPHGGAVSAYNASLSAQPGSYSARSGAVAATVGPGSSLDSSSGSGGGGGGGGRGSSSGSMSDNRDSLTSNLLFGQPLWLDDDAADTSSAAAAGATAAGADAMDSGAALVPQLPFAQRRDSLCRNSFCAMLATLENELLIDDHYPGAAAGDSSEALLSLPHTSSADLGFEAQDADAGAVAAAAAAVAVNHTVHSSSSAADDAAHSASLESLELFDRPGFSSTLIDFAYEMQDLLGDDNSESGLSMQQRCDEGDAMEVSQQQQQQQHNSRASLTGMIPTRRSSLSELVSYAGSALMQSSVLDHQQQQQLEQQQFDASRSDAATVASEHDLLDLDTSPMWQQPAAGADSASGSSVPLNAATLSAAAAAAAADDEPELSSRKRSRDFEHSSDLQQGERGGLAATAKGLTWAFENGGATRAQLRSSIVSALSSLSADCDDMAVVSPEQQMEQMQLVDSDSPRAGSVKQEAAEMLPPQQQQRNSVSVKGEAARASRRWSTMTHWMDGNAIHYTYIICYCHANGIAVFDCTCMHTVAVAAGLCDIVAVLLSHISTSYHCTH
jgi:hypothetical protein